MMIGVLSDTHSFILPQPMLNAFKQVEMIIHAGDICDKDVLKELNAIKPVKAVCGNMDDETLKKKLPLTQVIECQGVLIGVCHGHGGKDALTKAQETFKGQNVHAVIFGHSHQPLCKTIDGVLYFNPGSPNDTVKAPYCSYGLLHIQAGKVRGEIVKL